ncbi:hypothetical protein O181_056630 [Austropuccinia psidii MF-1]|uniref:Uncharacterized protein n=1 Tax=Austropuccinia psidii MF-1 TaxID=1389203 RepID=A0A9Q3E6G2_9BASI|nr:hypothetical protein [Austropuccinia psidii MF-1]
MGMLYIPHRLITPLNQSEGIRNSNRKVLDIENSQMKDEFSTSFHNLELSMGQECLKKASKLKEWPHSSGEEEYYHMELIRGIDMIKEELELPDQLVTEIFRNLFTKSAHSWYIKVRQAHEHQSWTWWKTQTINKWANNDWTLEVEIVFGSSKFKASNDRDLPWLFQQNDRLTALYPDISEFMIHRRIMRQCGGDLEHVVKSSTNEKSSVEDIRNILNKVNT